MLTRLSLSIVLLLSIGIGYVNAQGTRESTDCVEEPYGYVTLCGYITLPQDYDNPDTGNVEIYYIQIKSTHPNPQPDPLVYLVGGPGSSGSQIFLTSFYAYLHPFAEDRDVIVLDQRGTGYSNPSLYCQEALHQLPDILQSTQETHATIVLNMLTQCHDRLSEDDIQFATFNSQNNAHDVVNVMLSLGYEEWNLVGVSYGSRLALTMMRDYPQYLRSVILDSVYPLQADLYVDAYYSGERSLSVLFDACANDTECNALYPDLETIFYDAYNDLNQFPLIVELHHPTLGPLRIELSGYRLYDWVFSWLYSNNSIKMIPRLIYELDSGNVNYLIQMGTLSESTMLLLSLGMHYTVQCQEEFISEPNRDYATLIETYPHLDGYLSYLVEGMTTVAALCDIWQAEARSEIANTAVTSDIPTLLLTGDFDPITPPEFANLATETLSTAYNIVFPYVAHGVLRSEECSIYIALDFIDTPTSEPNMDCVAKTKPVVFD
jgi:pimeloyl-ACP methyl ester carboxylesterase